jgi:hypothetical protein
MCSEGELRGVEGARSGESGKLSMSLRFVIQEEVKLFLQPAGHLLRSFRTMQLPYLPAWVADFGILWSGATLEEYVL